MNFDKFERRSLGGFGCRLSFNEKYGVWGLSAIGERLTCILHMV